MELGRTEIADVGSAEDLGDMFSDELEVDI